MFPGARPDPRSGQVGLDPDCRGKILGALSYTVSRSTGQQPSVINCSVPIGGQGGKPVGQHPNVRMCRVSNALAPPTAPISGPVNSVRPAGCAGKLARSAPLR